MGRTGGAGDRLENSLDNYDESRSSTTGTTGHHHHHHHHHQRQEEGEAVSGQYAGTEAGDALTGQRESLAS